MSELRNLDNNMMIMRRKKKRENVSQREMAFGGSDGPRWSRPPNIILIKITAATASRSADNVVASPHIQEKYTENNPKILRLLETDEELPAIAEDLQANPGPGLAPAYKVIQIVGGFATYTDDVVEFFVDTIIGEGIVNVGGFFLVRHDEKPWRIIFCKENFPFASYLFKS